MKAKHTPGPWQILPEECDKPYIRIRGTVLGGRYKVANVLTLVYDGAPEREAEETQANARLIAAAPELLELAKIAEKHLRREFLKLAEKYAGTPYENDPAYIHAKQQLDNARAAIASASGLGTRQAPPTNFDDDTPF